MNIKNEIMEQFDKRWNYNGDWQNMPIFNNVRNFLSQALTRIEEETREEERAKAIIDARIAVYDIYNKHYAHVTREYNEVDEFRDKIYKAINLLSPSEEKEFVSDTNVTSKEEEECICKECQNGEICEACEDFGHQSPKKEKRER